LFNISDKIKLDYIARIFHKDGWTAERIEDAIEHVLKTNIYNTQNVGLEPGKLLQYDRSIKIFSQAEVLQLTGNGTIGYTLVRVPGVMRRNSYNELSDLWYIKDSDVPLMPDSWR